MIMDQSALMGGLKGDLHAQNAGFGIGLGTESNKLLCCTNCTYDEGSDPRVHLPASYSEPTVTNIHSYPCVEITTFAEQQDPTALLCASISGTPVDATATATALYNGVATFLQGRSANYLVFGETNHVLGRHLPPEPDVSPACKQLTFQQQATQNVSGFLASQLGGRANTVLRVWNDEVDRPRCFVRPNVPNGVNPPYDPNSQ